MENYENEIIPAPKQSPFADSPYECVYIAPQTPVKEPKPQNRCLYCCC